MTYTEEIKKLIIDKVLLGAIVGLAIYIGSIQLEQLKAKESFKSELNKVRIIKIAEVWQQAAEFEADFYKLYHAIDDAKISMIFNGNEVSEESIYKMEEIKPYIELVSNSRSKLFEIIRKNNFYLGPLLEDQVLEFHRSLAFVDLYQKVGLNNALQKAIEPISIDEAKNRVDHFRASISQIREYIVDGGW